LKDENQQNSTARQQRRSFCIVSSLGMKNGFTLTTPNIEKPFATPANPQYRRQNGICMERRQSSIFGGIRRVYYELLKSDQRVTGISAENKLSV